MMDVNKKKIFFFFVTKGNPFWHTCLVWCDIFQFITTMMMMKELWSNNILLAIINLIQYSGYIRDVIVCLQNRMKKKIFFISVLKNNVYDMNLMKKVQNICVCRLNENHILFYYVIFYTFWMFCVWMATVGVHSFPL